MTELFDKINLMGLKLARKSTPLKLKEPQYTRNGKKINLFQQIQEANIDTEIYPTLEKYGCIDKINTNVNAVFGDMTEYKNLRDFQQKEQKLNEMWNNLDINIRKEFGNDKYEFANKGENWIKNKINEMKIKAETKTEIKTETKGE